MILQGSASKSRFSTEKDCSLNSPVWRSKGHLKGQGDYDMTLDKIVTEYLRKQHALCRNPVTTCPPMSLFKWVATFNILHVWICILLIKLESYKYTVLKVTVSVWWIIMRVILRDSCPSIIDWLLIDFYAPWIIDFC